MSDETASAPENDPTPKASPAPRARRISTPRPKKAAKEAAPAEAAAPEPAPVAAPEVESIPFPTSPRREEIREERQEAAPQGENDWPEPDAESGGGNQSQSESSKRKRRRRKGKGQGQGNGPQNNAGEPSNEEPRPADAPQDPRPRPQPAPQHPQQPRAKIDPELLTKMAWKVYLAEVSEEGVALIGDNDAKDLAREEYEQISKRKNMGNTTTDKQPAGGESLLSELLHDKRAGRGGAE
jgi:hypothetical protein